MRNLLLFHAFTIGYSMMGLEMLGARILSPYFGSGIHIWAAVITCMLVSIAIGSIYGGRIADKSSDLKKLGWAIIIANLYVFIFVFIYDSVFKYIYSITSIPIIGVILSALLMIAIPIALIGMYSPFAIRFSLDEVKHSGNISGDIYGVSTIGSVLGTLIVTLVFIPNLNVTYIFQMLCMVGLFSGLVFLKLDKISSKKISLVTNIGIILFLVTQLVFFFALKVERPQQPLSLNEFQDLQGGVVYRKVSNYNFIQVKKINKSLNLHHYFFSQNHYESTIDFLNPFKPVGYEASIIGSIFIPKKLNNILILGLGGGRMGNIINHYLPNINIENVEIDPEIVYVAKRYFQFNENENNKVIVSDARLFLNHTKSQYDLIIVDIFNGLTVPYHVSTREFFQTVLSRMSPNGCVAMNVSAKKSNYTSLLKTFSSVFSNIVSFENIHGITNKTIVSCKGVILNEAELIARLANFKINNDILNISKKLMNAYSQVDNFENGRLLTDAHAPVNLLDFTYN